MAGLFVLVSHHNAPMLFGHFDFGTQSGKVLFIVGRLGWEVDIAQAWVLEFELAKNGIFGRVRPKRKQPDAHQVFITPAG